MQKIFEDVKSIVVERLGVEESKVTLQAKFKEDLGADSLDIVELIMAMSGHTSYKSFKAYVKASLEEKADAIERIWEERYKHLRDEEQP